MLANWTGNITNTNLIYIKMHKAASSTTCGVIRRISSHHGLSGYTDSKWITHEPGMWANHGFALKEPGAPSIALIQKLKLPTFRFTILRDPASRCLSHYYHTRVSRQGILPSAHDKISYMRSECVNKQFEYVRPGYARTAAEVAGFYHAIGTAELYDDSMVILSDRLGIPLTDVLYVSSKNSTEERRDDTGSIMVAHPSSDMEPWEVREHVNNAFRDYNKQDYALWNLATTWVLQ